MGIIQHPFSRSHSPTNVAAYSGFSSTLEPAYGATALCAAAWLTNKEASNTIRIIFAPSNTVMYCTIVAGKMKERRLWSSMEKKLDNWLGGRRRRPDVSKTIFQSRICLGCQLIWRQMGLAYSHEQYQYNQHLHHLDPSFATGNSWGTFKIFRKV
jgi:hypothetical protein